MKGITLVLATSACLLAACGGTGESTQSTELPLECNEVVEKQVQLFKQQDRSEAEIEAARKGFESEFSKLDPEQAAEICKKQLQPSAASS